MSKNTLNLSCDSSCTFSPRRGNLFVCFILATIYSISSLGQINRVNVPQSPTPAPMDINYTGPLGNQNAFPNSNNGTSVYEQDLKRQKQKQEETRQLLNEIDNDYSRAVSYELPSCASKQGAEYFRQAFSKLQQIIQSDSLNIKQSVFAVENAFFENKMKEDDFDKYLKQCLDICKWKLKKGKFKENDQLAKILVLYQFFADTIRYVDSKTNQWKIHYPFKYDFDDYEGRKDYSKMFVSKLMATRSGQCHSLPLLFLILAEQWNVDAYLSYSPNHSFVRFKDKNGKIRNIELTNGRLTTDSWVAGSGYVKAEALKSRIYLDTLSKKKVIAQCFNDLAQEYAAKYCYDAFVLQCSNEAIKYFPNDIFAQEVKSDYYSLLFAYVVKQIGRPPVSDLPKYPQAYNIFLQRNQQYDLIDNLGFEPMPSEAYQKWLQSVQDEKNKEESQHLILNIKQSLQKN